MSDQQHPIIKELVDIAENNNGYLSDLKFSEACERHGFDEDTEDEVMDMMTLAATDGYKFTRKKNGWSFEK
jgi:hypothetical protein